VNGRIVPLRYQLQSGDTVEIVTTDNQAPSKDWLKLVKTSRAKARIRTYVKAQQGARSVAVGQQILERDLARHNLDLRELGREGTLNRIATELAQKDANALLAAVGYGRISSQQILAKLLPAEEIEKRAEKAEKAEGRFQRLLRLVSRQAKVGVTVSGIDDVLIRFGKCCQPLPGERITGFITRGRGVTVHALDCPKVLESDPQRRIDVQWDDAKVAPRAVRVEVTCVDRPGLLAAMSKAISSAGVNISHAQVHALGDKKAQNVFDVMVASADELGRVMRNLGRVRGVMRVARVRT
jgi:GTP pyrophosphokinase